MIPNPVAEAWMFKLVEITINPSAVTIAKIVNIVFVFINKGIFHGNLIVRDFLT